MTFSRPANETGSSRFWLALSLSTVTAAAVAVPLGLKAVNVESQSRIAPIAPAVADEVPQSPSTTLKLLPSIKAFEPGEQRGVIAVVPVEEVPQATTSTVSPTTIPQPDSPSVDESTSTTAPETTELAPSTSVVEPTSTSATDQPTTTASL